MFDADLNARADIKPGTLYAICGEESWVYYGQVTADKRIGLFGRRDRQLVSPAEILTTEVMAVIGVNYPSIGKALRAGAWCKLGRFPLANSLEKAWPMVFWSVGTLFVLVVDGDKKYETRADNAAIQDMEIASSHSAVYHLPARLSADFRREGALGHRSEGSVWRMRRDKEEFARRFPEDPCRDQFPSDWDWTKDI